MYLYIIIYIQRCPMDISIATDNEKINFFFFNITHRDKDYKYDYI